MKNNINCLFIIRVGPKLGKKIRLTEIQAVSRWAESCVLFKESQTDII